MNSINQPKAGRHKIGIVIRRTHHITDFILNSIAERAFLELLPGGIISNHYFRAMFFTYVLYSHHDNKLYIGYTQDLKLRISQHDKGEVQSTKSRRPLELIYYDYCIEKWDAIKREKYFKTHYGRMYLKKRLKTWYENNSG